MSAFIMDENAVSKLATYTAALLNMGYNYFGMEAPKSLYNALSFCCDKYGHYNDEKIYNALYSLNVAAVNGRYRGSYQLENFDKFKPLTAYKRPKYNGHYIIDKWMLEMSKRLACFCYQCDEKSTYKDPLLLAIKELEQSLNAFIVHNMVAWNNARWGE